MKIKADIIDDNFYSFAKAIVLILEAVIDGLR